MKQVLLFDTAIATTNTGDEIILDSVKKGLKPILYEALFFRLGTHIENYSLYQMNNNWKYHMLCEKADYKFICGTNLIVNNLSIRNLFPQWMLFPWNAKLYKDSVLVGAGKVSDYKTINKYTKWLYSKVLSKKYKHSVRDEASKKVLENLGLQAINTGCPTLWSLSSEFCEMIPRKKSDSVVLSVSGYTDQSNKELDQIMIDIIKNNYSKVYAWIQTVMDKNYLDSLLNTDNIEYIYSLEKYSDILNQGNTDYVGTRLHGGVFALQHRCRTIVIAIDQRAIGFHESNNLPIIVRENIMSDLEKKINTEWSTNIKLNQSAINKFILQFV